jgi:lipopolysaccharide biosynthesis glycosyltransferase
MNNIPVVFASDNNYVIPTIVAITSMLINKNQDTFYQIYILENGITPENKKKFYWLNFKDEYEITFFQINLKELEQWKGNGNWPITTFGRFFVCDLLSEHNKCIYLDGDTLVLDDLTNLYNVDLTNNCLGGVKSPGTNYNVLANKHAFLSKESDKYFLKCINAGVLVMNLELLRNNGGGEYLKNKTFEISNNLEKGKIVTDQDILNALFVDKIVYVDLKYNFYINNILNNYERHYYPFFFSRLCIEEAFSHPVIIHYTLPEKPWIYSDAKAVYASFYKFSTALWQDYYNKSPISKQKLKKKRLGFPLILWHHLKPLLRKSSILLKLKRSITKTPVFSPIHDFFD